MFTCCLSLAWPGCHTKRMRAGERQLQTAQPDAVDEPNTGTTPASNQGVAASQNTFVRMISCDIAPRGQRSAVCCANAPSVLCTVMQVWADEHVEEREVIQTYDCMFAALSSLPQLRALTVRRHQPPTPEGAEMLPDLKMFAALVAPRLTKLDVDVWLPPLDTVRCRHPDFGSPSHHADSAAMVTSAPSTDPACDASGIRTLTPADVHKPDPTERRQPAHGYAVGSRHLHTGEAQPDLWTFRSGPAPPRRCC